MSDICWETLASPVLSGPRYNLVGDGVVNLCVFLLLCNEDPI